MEALDEVIDKAIFVGVRRPLTKKAINLMIGDERIQKLQIIGNPGLLLKEYSQNGINTKVEKIIGINWGTTFNRIYGGSEKQVEDQLVETAKKLIHSRI